MRSQNPGQSKGKSVNSSSNANSLIEKIDEHFYSDEELCEKDEHTFINFTAHNIFENAKGTQTIESKLSEKMSEKMSEKLCENANGFISAFKRMIDATWKTIKENMLINGTKFYGKNKNNKNLFQKNTVEHGIDYQLLLDYNKGFTKTIKNRETPTGLKPKKPGARRGLSFCFFM